MASAVGVPEIVPREMLEARHETGAEGHFRKRELATHGRANHAEVVPINAQGVKRDAGESVLQRQRTHPRIYVKEPTLCSLKLRVTHRMNINLRAKSSR
jgi:hypothetical protein